MTKPADVTLGNTSTPCDLATISFEPGALAYSSVNALSTAASISRRLAAGSALPPPAPDELAHPATRAELAINSRSLRFIFTSWLMRHGTPPDQRQSAFHDLDDVVLADCRG